MALKDLSKGKNVKLSKLSREEHKTTPPARFTETSLIDKLEKLGIGRPSTFSSIVTINQTRGYVKKVGQQLYPTWLGFKIAQFLENNLPNFVAYEATAELDEELDKIEEGILSKIKFLSKEWGSIEKDVKPLGENIDWEEVNKSSIIDLNNGFLIRVNKFGAFLEKIDSPMDENGNRRGAMLSENDDVSQFDFSDPQICEEIYVSSTKNIESNELGILTNGEYSGWVVTAKNGRYGEFVQAVKAGSDPKKVKPINYPMPEGLTVSTVTLSDVAPLFAEVKLPRTLSPNLFTGIGKKGQWLGYKTSATARRATFIGLPGEYNPRTITLDEAKKVWADHEQKKASKPAKKTTPAKKASVKKTPVKKTII